MMPKRNIIAYQPMTKNQHQKVKISFPSRTAILREYSKPLLLGTYLSLDRDLEMGLACVFALRSCQLRIKYFIEDE